jgi:AcrR family transcriptional regulator
MGPIPWQWRRPDIGNCHAKRQQTGPRPRYVGAVADLPAAAATRPRGRPTADEAPAATDEAILDAALGAFAEHGFAATSVRELARGLGVSHNLVPQRFGSKERLWYAAVDHGFAALAEAARFEIAAGDEFETIRRLIIGFVEATATRPALLQIINQEATHPGPRLHHLYERYIGPTTRSVENALECLYRDGRARRVPTAAFYFLLTHGAAGPLAMSALAGHFGPPVTGDDPGALHEYAESVADLLLHGISRDGPARRRRRR